MKNNNLHNVKSSGFKTPNNYFESFETDLFERLNEKEYLKSSETSGFTVPKDYFESVENTILEKLNDSSKKPVIVLKPRSTFYYVAGIAASFAILFGLVFNNDSISFENIDTALIENYLYQEEYSNDDFASLFKTSDISEIDFIDINVSDETLNQYFENIEPEDLIFD
ncbi:hypothetical protein ADIWIN_3017 [Winogradskyella psychrotolerans RS-3]|uniref:Uncharacterized protein n=1 Tax=Winogradskyella psychrotolerans RS-3 TaxID=641526 RepID=S7X829_9FLAO|nr:hypothetical protein [Winogradskyella psychrotolerans]EPR72178.1 hypothetical protein ADIWIN_3017 [Winogradskyella psychrotolerans RS-3]